MVSSQFISFPLITQNSIERYIHLFTFYIIPINYTNFMGQILIFRRSYVKNTIFPKNKNVVVNGGGELFGAFWIWEFINLPLSSQSRTQHVTFMSSKMNIIQDKGGVVVFKKVENVFDFKSKRQCAKQGICGRAKGIKS